MRTSTLVILAALLCPASPAFACKMVTQYPEHLWGPATGWWRSYRVVEIVETSDDYVVAIVKRNFENETDVGKRIVLRFLSNEEAHAMCEISLGVGLTYLIQSKNNIDPLLISRFNWLNIPSTHPKFDDYVRDLEKTEFRPMYVEANTVTFESQNNRMVVGGKVQVFFKDFMLFADRVTDDRNVNELIAEGRVHLLGRDGSRTREDRLRLPDDYRDAFRGALIEPRSTPWD